MRFSCASTIFLGGVIVLIPHLLMLLEAEGIVLAGLCAIPAAAIAVVGAIWIIQAIIEAPFP